MLTRLRRSVCAVAAAGVVLGTGLGLAVSPAWALSGSTEVKVTKAIMSSCKKNLKVNGLTKKHTDNKVNSYCSCLGTKIAKELNTSELRDYLKSNGGSTVHTRDLTHRAERSCKAKYLH